MVLWPRNPEQQRKLMVGLVALILLSMYYLFVHAERKTEIAALDTRLDALEAKTAAAKALAIQGGPALEDELAMLGAHMLRLEQLIPQREEVPELLHALTLRAQGAGIELTRMSPRLEEPGPYYGKQTYEIGIKGTAHRVGRYLAEVGSLRRIVTPIQLTLHSVSDETDGNGSPLLDASFHIVTYIAGAATTVAAQQARDGRAGQPAAPARAAARQRAGQPEAEAPAEAPARAPARRGDSTPIRDHKLIFEREVFVYPAGNRRDPFVPLGSDGMGPMFEDLSLRMIIFAELPAESMVVLADRSERWYRLHRGDTLGNATVVEVTPTRAVFIVEDYGKRRREVLDLRPDTESEGA